MVSPKPGSIRENNRSPSGTPALIVEVTSCARLKSVPAKAALILPAVIRLKIPTAVVTSKQAQTVCVVCLGSGKVSNKRFINIRLTRGINSAHIPE